MSSTVYDVSHCLYQQQSKGAIKVRCVYNSFLISSLSPLPLSPPSLSLPSLSFPLYLSLPPSLPQLITELQRLGTPNFNGQPQVTFGHFFEETSNIFEALSGTLNTARKLKVRVLFSLLCISHPQAVILETEHNFISESDQ